MLYLGKWRWSLAQVILWFANHHNTTSKFRTFNANIFRTQFRSFALRESYAFEHLSIDHKFCNNKRSEAFSYKNRILRKNFLDRYWNSKPGTSKKIESEKIDSEQAESDKSESEKTESEETESYKTESYKLEFDKTKPSLIQYEMMREAFCWVLVWS